MSAQLNPTDPATAELVQRILAEMVEDATNGRASNGDGNGDGNSINVDVDGRMHGNSNPDVADAAAAAGVDDDDVAKNKQLPALPYLHIGGDEVDLDAYGKTTSEALRAWATFDRTMRQGTRPPLVQMRSNVRTASVALSCLFESAVPFSSVQFVFKNAQCYDNLTINKLQTHLQSWSSLVPLAECAVLTSLCTPSLRSVLPSSSGKPLQAYVQGGGKVIQWEEAFALRTYS